MDSWSDWGILAFSGAIVFCLVYLVLDVFSHSHHERTIKTLPEKPKQPKIDTMA